MAGGLLHILVRERSRTILLWVAIILMLLAAAVRLPSSLHTLTVGTESTAARDLRAQQNVTKVWFRGEVAYGKARLASNPPATYALLWPLVGWNDAPTARWLWALLTLCALGALGFVAVRVSGGQRWTQRAAFAVLPFSIYGSEQSIWNGQLTPLVLSALGLSMLLLEHPRRSWWREALLVGCFLIALAKPSLSAPFFWIVVWRRGGVRTSTLIVGGYLLLTVLAALFQADDTVSVFAIWIERAELGVEDGTILGGYATVSELLPRHLLRSVAVPASLGVLGLCGLLVFIFRDRDLWLLVGLVAIVARMWTYHRIYDDAVVLFALLAIARALQQRQFSERSRISILAVLLLLWTACLVPVSPYYQGAPWSQVFIGVQTFTWLVALGCILFLLMSARPDSADRSP